MEAKSNRYEGQSKNHNRITKMKINLKDPNVIKQIVADLEGSEDKDRKKHSFESWECYSGNLKNYVEKELQRIRPTSWESYTVSNISIPKIVVDKIAKSYKDEPLREIEGTDQQKERLSDIYRESDSARQMRFFDTILNLHKYGLIWLNYRDNEDRYQTMSLQGHEFSVILDKDTGKLIGVILNYGNKDITSGSNLGDGVSNLIAEAQADSSADSEVYALWSDEHHVAIKVTKEKVMTAAGEVIKKNIEYVPIDNNENGINKLGRLPFVYASKETAIDYPTRSNLKDQAITYNALMSELLTSSSIQGSGVLTFSYPEEQEGQFKNISTGLTSAIKLPQLGEGSSPTTANYISPSPDLAGQKEVISTYLKQILSEKGINSGSAIGSDMQSFSSGLERAIAESNVQDIIEMNQDIYIQIEKELFEIIKAWEKLLGKNTFADDMDLKVVFGKPKVMISDREVLDNIKTRLDLGLIEKWEALMILDPNLSESEAKDKMANMEESNAQRMRDFIGNNKENNAGPQGNTEQSPS